MYLLRRFCTPETPIKLLFEQSSFVSVIVSQRLLLSLQLGEFPFAFGEFPLEGRFHPGIGGLDGFLHFSLQLFHGGGVFLGHLGQVTVDLLAGFGVGQGDIVLAHLGLDPQRRFPFIDQPVDQIQTGCFRVLEPDHLGALFDHFGPEIRVRAQLIFPRAPFGHGDLTPKGGCEQDVGHRLGAAELAEYGEIAHAAVGHSGIHDAVHVDDPRQLQVAFVREFQALGDLLQDIAVRQVGVIETRGVDEDDGRTGVVEWMQHRLFGTCIH